jgi:lysophospholipase L1-like esterase
MPRLNVMFVGDSVTVGTLGSTSVGGYRGQLLTARSYQGVPYRAVGTTTTGMSGGEARMCGASGLTVGDLIPYVTTDGATYSWDIALVHAGTNDCTQRNAGGTPTLATSQANLTLLLDKLRTQNPAGRVFFAKIIPNTTAAVDTLIDAQNTAFATQIAARSDAALITVVDHNAAFKANASWATEWMGDATHPNDQGYKVVAATWGTALTAAGF